MGRGPDRKPRARRSEDWRARWLECEAQRCKLMLQGMKPFSPQRAELASYLSSLQADLRKVRFLRRKYGP